MPFDHNNPKYRPVCQVQREILFFAERLPECSAKHEIIDRVNEALRMSKRMDSRLKNLSPRYNHEIWMDDHTTGKIFEPFVPGSRGNKE